MDYCDTTARQRIAERIHYIDTRVTQRIAERMQHYIPSRLSVGTFETAEEAALEYAEAIQWKSPISCSLLREDRKYRQSFEKDSHTMREDLGSVREDLERMREDFLDSKRDECSTPPWLAPLLQTHFFNHDVFLSFRGKDVRETLVNDLSDSLSRAGVRVYLDSKDLKKGAKIWLSLKSAIAKSAICIPIFSEGYADSTWCLKESAEMLKTGHLIIPLFYGVDPTDVRYPLNKRSRYKRSFEKHYGHPDRHSQEEIDGWKNGLEDICSRLGWTMGITQDFHVGVEAIVRDVINILHSPKETFQHDKGSCA